MMARNWYPPTISFVFHLVEDSDQSQRKKRKPRQPAFLYLLALLPEHRVPEAHSNTRGELQYAVTTIVLEARS